MNSAELHLWVLQNVRPMAEAALVAQGELVGTNDDGELRRFLTYTGECEGIAAVERALLELVVQLHEAEVDERRRRDPVFDD